MSVELQDQQNRTAGPERDGRTYVVHLGTITLKYRESPVLAGRILTDAGFTPPEEYVLEMLQGPRGPAVQQFQPGEPVTLDEAHARHFRAVPVGGGRA